MSHPEWPERDEDLDGMLGSLGTPELARPQAAPAEILGRAILLAPPVVVGLTGWRLAATLAVAVGGGFLGGMLARERGTPGAAEQGLAQVAAEVAADPAPEDTRPVVEADPECVDDGLVAPPGSPSAAASASPVLAARVPPRAPSGALAADPPTAPPAGSGELASAATVSCPEPALATHGTPTLQEDDLAAIAALLPASQGAEPEATASAPVEDEDDSASLSSYDASPARHALQGSVGAGVLVLPGAATGMLGELSLRRLPEASSRHGSSLGASVDIGLLSAAPVGRWSSGLSLELGHAWNLRRLSLDAGFSLGARLILPAREHEIDPEDPPPLALESRELQLVPVAGPKLGLSFGGADNRRVRVDLAPQISRGRPEDGPQPWISLVVGSTFDVGTKKDG